jgi:hypothetical protein
LVFEAAIEFPLGAWVRLAIRALYIIYVRLETQTGA